MYPTLDIRKLTHEIKRINDVELQEGRKLRDGRVSPRQVFSDPDNSLHHDAWRLLQVIRKTLDDRMIAEQLYDATWTAATPFGLQARDIRGGPYRLDS